MSAAWDLELADAELARMPRSGGLLLLCNRPYGGRETQALLSRFRSRRGDWKVLGDPRLEGGAALREPALAEAWLAQGGALLAYVGPPLAAGRLGRVRALDEASAWAALARRSRAAIQALRLDGGKRRPFVRALGLDKEGLRQRLLRAALPAARPRLRAALAAPLTAARLASLPGEREAGETLLLRFWLLARRGRVGARKPGLRRRLRQGRQRPLASALPPALLEAELAALPASARLAASGEMECWAAPAQAIPGLLREIGRLRELSFRAVGEGTGQPLDLDRFDQHYLHLFLWHRGQRALAGAYRFARVDQVLAAHGLEGLYTHSLLRFQPALLAQLEPALELGRSFVAPGFQKGYGPLLLLWKGLGQWIAAHPRYRRLFGLVSMSAEFQPLSRELLASFAKQHCFRGDLARLTRPRRPYLPAYIPSRHDPLTWRLGADLEEIDRWISEIEPDGKGLPVLIRQYHGLGAYFFGFNVDPGFGDALDGLICVDLARSDPRMLARTMGTEAAQAFLRQHQALA